MDTQIKTSIASVFSHLELLPPDRQLALVAAWWAEREHAASECLPQLYERARRVAVGSSILAVVDDRDRDEERIVLVVDRRVVDVTVLARQEACPVFSRLLELRSAGSDVLAHAVSGVAALRFDCAPHGHSDLARGYRERPRSFSMKGFVDARHGYHGVVLRSATLPGDVIVREDGSRFVVVRNAASYGDARRVGWHEFEAVAVDRFERIAWLWTRHQVRDSLREGPELPGDGDPLRPVGLQTIG